MNALVPKHAEHVTGELSGWDRVVLRGTLRMLTFVEGMMGYLSRAGVLLKNFGDHAQAMTARLIDASLAAAQETGRPVEYLPSPKDRKDDVAREIAMNDDVQDGLICVLTCVEPCQTYDIYRNRDKKKLELVSRTRKCKFLYHYAEALASFDTSTPVAQLAAKVCRPTRKDGTRYRALRPWSEQDRKLLEAISDGQLAIEGFCNRDVASRLYPTKSDDKTQRARIASKVSYRLRILRAHGLIRTLPRRRRYHMTTKGRQIVTALLQTQHATLQQLNATAA